MTETTAEPRPAAAPPDEFYVGYLPMPPGYAFYVRMIMPGFLWVAVGIAALLSSSQVDPGDGVWNTGRPRVFRGLVDASPYPMIHVPGAGGAAVETLLLVETGKFGGGKRAAPFDGRTVQITGWLIERDGRKMIEMESGEAAIALVPPTDEASDAPPRPTPRSRGPVTLRGEIVDSKCFLGVMKPGEGKAHKECATLCIAGGIPPMLVTRDAAGSRSYFLLTGVEGRSLDDRILPFVADPVEVTGTLEDLGSLRLLRIDPAVIRRL
jgi:hypothetical protein